MTDSSGNTEFATEKPADPQDYEARLRTAATLMQTATAERMHDLGLPRRTFRLERDQDGRVIVHTLKGNQTADHYHSLSQRVWYREVFRWINSRHHDRYAKNVVLAAYTRKNPETGKMMAHTALGGSNLGLFGSASVFSWPRSLEETFEVFHDSRVFDAANVHDDSIGRSTIWALASTTIGATLHELGHTFGLPHCTEHYGIMTRGFDHFNRIFTFHDPITRRSQSPKYFGDDQIAHFAPISATFLQYQRWFALDAQDPVGSQNAAPITINVAGQDEQRKVTVACEDGVAWVGLMDRDPIFAFKHFGGNLAESDKIAHKSEGPKTEGTLPKQIEIGGEELQKMIGKRSLQKIRVLGGAGQTDQKELRKR